MTVPGLDDWDPWGAAELPAVAEPVRWAVPGVWEDDPAPEQVTPLVGELVAQVQELIGRIAAVDPALLQAGQALGEATALAAVQHQLRVLQLARTRDVTDRELYAHLGYRSSTAWQRETAPDAAVADRALAGTLSELPHLHAALREATVCFAAASKVKTALGTVRAQLDRPDGLIDGQPGEPVIEAVLGHVLALVCQDRFGLEHDPVKDPTQAAFLHALEQKLTAIQVSACSQREQVERAVVLLAEHLSVATLTGALEDVVLQILPSTLEDADQAAQDKRALSLTPNRDGTWELSATLTPEVGEQVHAALAAEARRDPANPLDTHVREQARAAAAQAHGADEWAAAMDRPGWEDRALREHGLNQRHDLLELVPARSRSKRLHDAFGRLLTRYLEHGLGGVSGKVPVQVTVTISDGTELKAVRAQYANRCAGLDCCSATPDPLTPLVPHHVRLHSVFGQTCIDETVLACDRLHADLHVGKKTIHLRDGRLITEHGYLETPGWPGADSGVVRPAGPSHPAARCAPRTRDGSG